MLGNGGGEREGRGEGVLAIQQKVGAHVCSVLFNGQKMEGSQQTSAF